MCGCLVALVAFFSPRLAIFLVWLFSDRMSIAFNSFWIGFIGFLFLPWTTLMYVLVAPGGVIGLDWLWLGLAIAADLLSYSSGGLYGRRRRSVQSA